MGDVEGEVKINSKGKKEMRDDPSSLRSPAGLKKTNDNQLAHSSHSGFALVS